MRGILLSGALVVLTGCGDVVGPFRRTGPPVRLNDQCLTIGEQKARQRQYLALPEQSANVAPRTDAEQPGFVGRQH